MITASKYFHSNKVTVQNSVKFLLFVGVAWFLLHEFFNAEQTYSIFPGTNSVMRMLILTVVVLGVPLNWYLESLKWHYLMNASGVNLSRQDAFKSTLAGAAVSTVLPNRVGESLGRIFWLPGHHKLAGAVQSALGGIAQLCVTLSAGAALLPLYLIFNTDLQGHLITAVSSTGIILAGLSVFFLFKLPQIRLSTFKNIPGSKWLEKIQQSLQQAKKNTLRRVLLISAARYVVFSLQFAAVLIVFVDSLSFISALGCVAVIYLVTTAVPSFTLAELGIRESVAVLLISPFSDESAAVIFATFFIWCINIAVPSLFGLYFAVMRKNLISKST